MEYRDGPPPVPSDDDSSSSASPSVSPEPPITPSSQPPASPPVDGNPTPSQPRGQPMPTMDLSGAIERARIFNQNQRASGQRQGHALPTSDESDIARDRRALDAIRQSEPGRDESYYIERVVADLVAGGPSLPEAVVPVIGRSLRERVERASAERSQNVHSTGESTRDAPTNTRNNSQQRSQSRPDLNPFGTGMHPGWRERTNIGQSATPSHVPQPARPTYSGLGRGQGRPWVAASAEARERRHMDALRQAEPGRMESYYRSRAIEAMLAELHQETRQPPNSTNAVQQGERQTSPPVASKSSAMRPPSRKASVIARPSSGGSRAASPAAPAATAARLLSRKTPGIGRQSSPPAASTSHPSSRKSSSLGSQPSARSSASPSAKSTSTTPRPPSRKASGIERRSPARSSAPSPSPGPSTSPTIRPPSRKASGLENQSSARPSTPSGPRAPPRAPSRKSSAVKRKSSAMSSASPQKAPVPHGFRNNSMSLGSGDMDLSEGEVPTQEPAPPGRLATPSRGNAQNESTGAPEAKNDEFSSTQDEDSDDHLRRPSPELPLTVPPRRITVANSVSGPGRSAPKPGKVKATDKKKVAGSRVRKPTPPTASQRGGRSSRRPRAASGSPQNQAQNTRATVRGHARNLSARRARNAHNRGGEPIALRSWVSVRDRIPTPELPTEERDDPAYRELRAAERRLREARVAQREARANRRGPNPRPARRAPRRRKPGGSRRKWRRGSTPERDENGRFK